MWLPWKAALALATALAIVPFLVVVGLFAKPRHRGVQYALAFARETAVVLGLYALWQFAGTLSLLHVSGAVARGDWIFDLQRDLHLPSELTVQHAALHSSLAVQALNLFYATAHFPGMIAFLIWMFVRHRDRYPQVRNIVVLVTGASLAIQLIPVAPPRLTPGLGFVDTPMLFHQSVYAPVGSPGPDQLSALPSVHVAWSVLVALGVILISTSRRRWWILAHPILTVLAVVATGNHWWFDGIVAVWLIGLAIVVEHLLRVALLAARARVTGSSRRPAPEILPRPDLVLTSSDDGDGKVWNSHVDTIVRVRTGEIDHDAI
jgi:hypothetical protein